MFDFLSKAGSAVMDGISSAANTVGDATGGVLSHAFERLQDPEFQEQARLFGAVMSNDQNRYQAALNAYDQRRAEIAKQKREDMIRAEERQWRLDDLKQSREWSVEDRDAGYTHDFKTMEKENEYQVQRDKTQHGYNIASQNNQHSNSVKLATHNDSLEDEQTEWATSSDGRSKILVYSATGKPVEGAHQQPIEDPNNSRKMTVAGEKEMMNGYDQATDLEAKARSANDLATRVEGAKDWNSGFLGNAEEMYHKFMGNQDEVSALKTDYTAFRNSEAVRSLPPGAASDNDVKIFLEGFPDKSWDQKKLASWLRGQAKVNAEAAKYNRYKADYISNHGSLRSSNGKSFYQNWEEYRKPQEPAEQRPAPTQQKPAQRHPDGTVLRGKDGKEYVVQGGVPVPR